MAAMTFNNTNHPLVEIPVMGAKEFFIDAYNANVSGCEDVVAAVAGKYHYIKRIVLDIAGLAGDPTVTIGSGETASAVTTVLTGPFTVAKEEETGTPANEEHFIPARHIDIDWAQGRNMGRKLTKGEALTIDSSAVVPVNIMVWGITV